MTAMEPRGHAVNLRNVLVLLGIVVTTASLLYFSFEFADLVSEWGRVASLVLLGVIFVALGVHFEQAGESEALSRSGWRWLKVTNALYVLGAVAAFASVVAFFAIQDLDRVWKVLVTLVIGLGLILAAARRFAPQR